MSIKLSKSTNSALNWYQLWSENPSQWTTLEPLCMLAKAILVHGVIGYKFCWLLPSEDHNQGTLVGHKSNGTIVRYHWEDMNRLRHQLGMNHSTMTYEDYLSNHWVIDPTYDVINWHTLALRIICQIPLKELLWPEISWSHVLWITQEDTLSQYHEIS